MNDNLDAVIKHMEQQDNELPIRIEWFERIVNINNHVYVVNLTKRDDLSYECEDAQKLFLLFQSGWNGRDVAQSEGRVK